MLSVKCSDELGNTLAQGHHIPPGELWPYIATIFEGYYNVGREDLTIMHNGVVLLGGNMNLGKVCVSNTEDQLIEDGPNDHLREVTPADRVAVGNIGSPYLYN